MMAATVAPCGRFQQCHHRSLLRLGTGVVMNDGLCPLPFRSGLRSRARLCTSLSFTLGHVVAPLRDAAHHRAATTPRRPHGAGGGATEPLVLSSSALRLAVPPLTLCFHTKSEQKVSNLLAGFAPRTGTGITARRYLKLLSSRRIGRPAQVRRFELRCHVGRPLGAPLAKCARSRPRVRNSPALVEKTLLPADRDRLGRVT